MIRNAERLQIRTFDFVIAVTGAFTGAFFVGQLTNATVGVLVGGPLIAIVLATMSILRRRFLPKHLTFATIPRPQRKRFFVTLACVFMVPILWHVFAQRWANLSAALSLFLPVLLIVAYDCDLLTWAKWRHRDNTTMEGGEP